MQILVDADSCPRRLRSIIRKAAERTQTKTVFVSDRKLSDAKGSSVENVLVEHGSGDVDDYIADHAEPGDLVFTHDVPLAARVVERGAVAIDDRGNVYNTENIRERLSLRDAMMELREAGVTPAGGNTLGEREVRLFAGAFDRELTKLQR
ncbi:MAG: YaiI/YqxD family protein [Spirochaetota bacterium]